jgi:hypothetical protein
MANRENGEVELVADKTYTLRFGSYAIAELEDKLNRPMVSIVQELENPDRRRVKTLIAAGWAALQEFHGEDAPDIKDAARIIDQAGFVVAATKIGECLQAAFPPAKKAGRAADEENPPNRKARRAAASPRRRAR